MEILTALLVVAVVGLLAGILLAVASHFFAVPENETAKMLCRIANEVTGDDKPMYIVKGGTYAHFLPNAYAFGMDGSLPPDDFPAGRGGAHGVDEAVSLDRLQRAMKIYARALLELNEMCI